MWATLTTKQLAGRGIRIAHPGCVTAHEALAAMCPDCAAGGAARALVFSDAFWVHAWYALLPFIVTMVVARWIVRRVDQGANPGANAGPNPGENHDVEDS